MKSSWLSRFLRFKFAFLSAALLVLAEIAPVVGLLLRDGRWVGVGLVSLLAFAVSTPFARRELPQTGAATRLYLLTSQRYGVVFALYFAFSALGGIYPRWSVPLFALQIVLLCGMFLLIKQQFALNRHLRAEQDDALLRLQAQGDYPAPGQGSDDDVRRLALNPQTRHFAVRLHRELHNSTLRDAAKAVRRLRS